MMKKLSLAITLIVVFSFGAAAQKGLYKEAVQSYELGLYSQAIEQFKAAYGKEKKDERKRKMLFLIAESYRHINKIHEAETHYAQALKAGYEDPIIYYHLGIIKKEEKNYPDAIVQFENYKKANAADATKADMLIKSCEESQKWIDSPTRHKVENMVAFNSKNSDFSPSFVDKKFTKLLFTSSREGTAGDKKDVVTGQLHTDIFETDLGKNGKWGPVQALGETVNTPVNEGSAIVSKKDNALFFTRCEETKHKRSKCHLYMAKKSGQGWGAPDTLPFNVDSLQFRHPALSSDGHILYFASTLPGGYGGYDIWYSELKGKDWSKPINMGPKVNSSGDEAFPFIHDNGKVIYFASNGHPGMGGLDMFKSEKGTAGWGEAENLKFPLNSPFDDFGIIFEGNKERGYFASNREGGKGDDDIWSFVLPPLVFKVKGTVLNQADKTVVPGCPVVLKGTDGSLVQTKTDAAGTYLMTLKENVSYEVWTESNQDVKSPTAKNGFLNNSERGKFTTVGIIQSQDFQKDFVLQPIPDKPGDGIHFPAVLYDVGKATLRPESKDSLDYLYRTLMDNPTIIIELQAHTDSRGNNKDNQILSQARAQSCVDYLISKGIPTERMKPKGWGEEKLKIKDAAIKKLKTKEEQEAAHQVNRRTVFAVLSWDYIDPTKPKVEIPTYHPPVTGEEHLEDNGGDH